MPEEILEAELFPIFSGYWGYRAAPLSKTMRHRLRLIGYKRVEARQNAEQEEQLAEQRREMERAQHTRR